MCKLVLFESVIDVRTELNLLTQQVKQHFSSEDLNHIKDLQKFVLKKEDGWVLDKNLHLLSTKILTDPSPEFVSMKVSLLRIFGVCALRDNFVHFLNFDRQGRIIMNYAANSLESLSLNEQKALVLLFCNLFSMSQSRSWLMYFSQWTTDSGTLTSNAEITCNLARNAMNSLNPQIQLYASGIVFNMSARSFGVAQPLDDIMEQLCPEEQPIGSFEMGNTDGICHLKAHNALFLQICISTFELLKKKSKMLQDNILWNYLQTLEKLLPNVKADFLSLNPDAISELSSIENLSTKNSAQLESVKSLLNCQIAD